MQVRPKPSQMHKRDTLDFEVLLFCSRLFLGSSDDIVRTFSKASLPATKSLPTFAHYAGSPKNGWYRLVSVLSAAVNTRC